MNTSESFDKGFRLAANGKIDHELTAREISVSYPDVDVDAFSNGVNDALAGDMFRYNYGMGCD